MNQARFKQAASIIALQLVISFLSTEGIQAQGIPNVGTPPAAGAGRGGEPMDRATWEKNLRQLRQGEIADMKIRGTFRVAVGGDIIETYPVAQLDDPSIQAVFKILHGADVAVANMESNTHDFLSSDGQIGGLQGPKEVAADVKAQGWTLLQRASNHATDQGTQVMLENLRTFRDVGIQVAGSGRNLQEARAPQFVSTPKGRVGLVGSFSSPVASHQGAPQTGASETDTAPVQVATYQIGFNGGLPGVNVLRLTKYNLLNQDDFSALNLIAQHDSGRGASPASAQETGAALNFRGSWFKSTNDSGRGLASYDMYPDDFSQIMKSVREGKESAQMMILTVHSHEEPGGSGEAALAPPSFLVQYAHQAIDNGADMFVATGPHELRGIEIYHGKPIFYGMASYAYMLNETPAGYDRYRDEKLDPFDTDFTPREVTWAGWPENRTLMEGKPMDPLQEESAVAEAVYQDGKLTEVKITPLDLNGRSLSDLGIPHVATGAIAKDILDRLQRLSKPLGTEITITGDVGFIKIGKS